MPRSDTVGHQVARNIIEYSVGPGITPNDMVTEMLRLAEQLQKPVAACHEGDWAFCTPGDDPDDVIDDFWRRRDRTHGG